MGEGNIRNIMSVCSSVLIYVRMKQPVHQWKGYFETFLFSFRISVEKILRSLKPGIVAYTLYLHLFIFMILLSSIICKIRTFIGRFAQQLTKNTLLQWSLSESGACEGTLWKSFSVRETRDWIIYLMRHMALLCWKIKSINTNWENVVFNPLLLLLKNN